MVSLRLVSTLLLLSLSSLVLGQSRASGAASSLNGGTSAAGSLESSLIASITSGLPSTVPGGSKVNSVYSSKTSSYLSSVTNQPFSQLSRDTSLPSSLSSRLSSATGSSGSSITFGDGPSNTLMITGLAIVGGLVGAMVALASFANDQHFRLNHTMFRIKDPKVSLPFYTDILGMELVRRMDMEAAKFTNYFLAFPQRDGVKAESEFQREGILELCHNWGTEDESGAVYANGNSDPGRGFGHICVSVDDINKTCEYLESKGVKFQKKLTDGRMKEIAFALDPDNYWIELIGNAKR